MKKLWITSLIITLILVAGLPESLQAGPSKKYINDSIVKASVKIGVPSRLLKAICSAESNLRPQGYVFSDGGKNNHAMGMCQVLRLTTVEMGMKDSNCIRDFRAKLTSPAEGISFDTHPGVLKRTYKTCQLFGPYTNAFYAAKYLKKQLDRYDGSWIAAIAAYNSGTLKTCQSKGYFTSRSGLKISCIPGAPINQKYVDRVLKYLYQSQPEIIEQIGYNNGQED